MIGINSHLDVWQNSPVKPSELEVFLITNSVSLHVISLFRDSVFPSVSFSCLCFSRNLLLNYPICWFTVVHSIPM